MTAKAISPFNGKVAFIFGKIIPNLRTICHFAMIVKIVSYSCGAADVDAC